MDLVWSVGKDRKGNIKFPWASVFCQRKLRPVVLGAFWIFYKTNRVCTKVDVYLTLLCIIFWGKLLLWNQCFMDIVEKRLLIFYWHIYIYTYIKWNFFLFYGEMEAICNILEMFLSCSSFQGLNSEDLLLHGLFFGTSSWCLLPEEQHRF